MKPDIFMDDFERTVWADAHYAAIGRALTFATRLEAGCKALNTILSLKKNRGTLDPKMIFKLSLNVYTNLTLERIYHL